MALADIAAMSGSNELKTHLKFHLILLQLTLPCYSLSLSLHFPGGPGLAGTRMSPFWTLLELRTMEVVMTSGAISSSQDVTLHFLLTNQHPVFLQAGCPSCHPTNSVRALKGLQYSINAL